MRLMIVDDHAGVRQLIRQFVATAQDTVCECASGDEAIRVAPEFRPDAITMDVRMPGSCGLTATKAIRAALPSARVVIVTSHDQPDLGHAAAQAGAAGFVLKDNLADLSQLIRMSVAADANSAPTSRPPAPTSVVASATQALLVLMVDACSEDCELVTAQLEASGYKPIVERVNTGESFRRALENGRWDLIITEYELPGFSGSAVIEMVQSLSLSLPVICVTGNFQPDHVRSILQAGAIACIDKNFPESLGDTVKSALRTSAPAPVSAPAGRLDSMRSEAGEVETLRARIGQLEEANRELRIFVRSIANDLEAPLRLVRTAASAMLDHDARGGATVSDPALRRIDEGCRLLNERVETLLGFVRLEEQVIQSQRVCMDALVADALAEVCSDEQRARVELRITALPDVWGDRTLLQTALANLLSNAFKFTTGVDRPVIEIGGLVRGTEATFFIKDNGAGFDMRNAGRLFQPFERLHSSDEFSGIGLGLATAHRIVQRHGGRLTAEAARGHGATFHCTLPAAQAEAGK